MKERPIIFNDEMVRAILAGNKTQTRRVKGLEAINKAPDKYRLAYEQPFHTFEFRDNQPFDLETERHILNCPLGNPGDRLWVREIFIMESNFGLGEIDGYEPPFKDGRPTKWEESFDWGKWWEQPHYRATDPEPDLVCEGKDGPACIWRPQLYMPRWASRIVLEVQEVRVERVRDITGNDARAEGCIETIGGNIAQKNFQELWDSISKDKPGRTWKENPWVWVITFRRM